MIKYSGRICLAILFLALGVFSLSAQPYRNPTIRQFQAEKLFLEGLEAYNNNQLRKALETFNEVIELDPGHKSVYELRGETYYRLEKFDEAFSDYQQASRQNPRNPKLRNDMGVAAARIGQYRAAIRYFTESLKLDANYADAQKNLSLARQRLESGGYPNKTEPGVDPWFGGTPGGYGNTDPLAGTTGGGAGFDPSRGNDLVGPIINLDSLSKPGNFMTSQRPNDRDVIYYGDNLSIGGQSDPYITIDQVKVTPQGTEVSFFLENPANKPFPVMLGKPGSKEAWMIVDLNMQRRYPLVQLQSIFSNQADEAFELPAGQRTRIIARFDRIADDMSAFHIMEGQKSFKGAWNFWEVKLKDR